MLMYGMASRPNDSQTTTAFVKAAGELTERGAGGY